MQLLRDMGGRFGIAGELLMFFWPQKMWWMIPMVTLLLGLGSLALVVIVRAWNSPTEDERRLYSLAIGVGVLALVVLLNEREVWATVRFGRLLAVPLVWYFGTLALESGARAHSIRIGISGIFLGLLASQFAFSYYMARVWTFTPL